jgi:hypothetical protein
VTLQCGRATRPFPCNRFAGAALRCIGCGVEPCVSAYTLLDVLLCFDLPIVTGAIVQLAITSLESSDTGAYAYPTRGS